MNAAMKTRGIIIILLICTLFPLHSQVIQEMEFRNQEITDILMALAQMSGRSIIPDETVEGTATYYFSGTTFNQAFQVFLSTYNLYVRQEDGVYYVSRINAEFDTENNAITLDAQDVSIQLLIRRISQSIGKTVLYDPLPRENISIHVDSVAPGAALNIIMRRFSDYEIEEDENYYYIRQIPSETEEGGSDGGPGGITLVQDGLYSIDVQRQRFRDLIDELFTLAGLEYGLLTSSDTMIDRMRFADRSFEEMLTLLCQHGNADFQLQNGVYYLFDIQRSDILKAMNETVWLSLDYISAQELPNLLPQDLASHAQYKIDRTTNSVILRGSALELAPLEEFIQSIDQPLEGMQYYRFELQHLSTENIVSLLPPQFANAQTILLPESNAFVMLTSQERREELNEYLTMIDRGGEGIPVRLRYIRGEDLLENLPPSVSEDSIVATRDESLVFYTGPEERFHTFRRDLELIDRPIPQIRYELLVVQYQDGEAIGVEQSAIAQPTAELEEGETEPDIFAVVGEVGELLNLNFDIISTFGYQFALNLNTDLSQNAAHVFADTTLNGVSGQDIQFQNTNTYRYRDVEVDPDTGESEATGVTREITAGLILSISGWVSGDGMITMDVSATVSKQGADTSGTTGSLPATSEKVITTQVRTSSGEPIVIGGLIQQDLVSTMSGIPLLSHIPFLGSLFRTETETYEETEMVIYIVPYLEHPDIRQRDLGLRFEEMYTRHAGRN
ncbi:MAG: hypothetical protein ACLFR1_11130 [Spirochaetia bacterium]